jgi:phosphoglycolate phosphatase
MSVLPKPRAVLFDWDGTLVDSFESIVAANNVVRAHFGAPPYRAEEIREIVEIGNAREIFATLYPDPAQAQQALDVYYTNIPRLRRENLGFIPGARKLIEFLQSAGVPMGVVSNMAHGPLIEEIAHVGWADYFQTIVGAGEAPRGKPAPDPVWLAIERLGLERNVARDIWFVGDMAADQKAAKAAGCPFVFYTGGIASDEHKKDLAAAVKLSHYHELLVMAKKLFVG